MAKLTTEEFIKKARAVHGDRYDYSKVEYVNNKTDVVIICSEHGEFLQKPNYHLCGNGCPECGGTKQLSTSVFVERSKHIHGDRYDYSKVSYVNNKTKVCIVCPKHGEFWQIPNSHLRGVGCPLCGVKRRTIQQTYTKETFLKLALEKHGESYDYSGINYVDTNTKISIVCPKHGPFWQKPAAHIQGQGCPQCGVERIRSKRSYSLADFIRLAKDKHGERYDYSKVQFVNYQTKVCIVCPKHGGFWQVPSEHVQGKGCPSCAGHLKLTTEEFIKRARHIHHNKYDYSSVRYTNSKKKVCIICPEHGQLWQTPNAHLGGAGCPICAQRIRVKSVADTQTDFIMKAKKVHGDKYDYSKVNYRNSATKVCIICPEHGEFWQTPGDHIAGHGCQKCAGWNIYDEETFYNGAHLFHGDKYDYSKVIFRDSAHKVCIICPKHGEFWQLPATHAYKGKGCPKCSLEFRAAERETPSEVVLREAHKYKYLKEFVKKKPSLYSIAIKRNIDISFLQRERHSDYTYEEVMNIAKSCRYASEFERKHGGAYNRAKAMGWYEDITWFELPEQFNGSLDAKNHTVYAYEDTDAHVVYVGLTNDIKRRHREHSHPHKHRKNSPVYEYFASKGMEVPSPKILAERLRPLESREIEDKWVQHYTDEGWNTINVAKTGRVSGSIGSYTRIWTIDALKAEASKYKTRTEFSKGSPSAYSTAYNRGVLADLNLIDEHPSKRPVRNIETGEVFASLSAAGRKYGVSPDYISWAAQGKRDSYAGFHWEFV